MAYQVSLSSTMPLDERSWQRCTQYNGIVETTMASKEKHAVNNMMKSTCESEYGCDEEHCSCEKLQCSCEETQCSCGEEQHSYRINAFSGECDKRECSCDELEHSCDEFEHSCEEHLCKGHEMSSEKVHDLSNRSQNSYEELQQCSCENLQHSFKKSEPSYEITENACEIKQNSCEELQCSCRKVQHSCEQTHHAILATCRISTGSRQSWHSPEVWHHKETTKCVQPNCIDFSSGMKTVDVGEKNSKCIHLTPVCGLSHKRKASKVSLKDLQVTQKDLQLTQKDCEATTEDCKAANIAQMRHINESDKNTKRLADKKCSITSDFRPDILRHQRTSPTDLDEKIDSKSSKFNKKLLTYIPFNFLQVLKLAFLLIIMDSLAVQGQGLGPHYNIRRVCVSDDQCNTDIGEVCWWDMDGCDTGQCQCDPRTSFYDSTFNYCRPLKYGDERCEPGDRCWEGMSCMDGYCQCNQGMMTSDKMFCLRDHERFLGQQCSRHYNICYQRTSHGYRRKETHCGHDGICHCNKGFKEDGYACRKWNVNEAGCHQDHHCQGGALCIDNICQCPSSYKAVARNSKCGRLGAKFDLQMGEVCDEDNEKGYCGSGLICHRCPSEVNRKCVRFMEAQALPFMHSRSSTLQVSTLVLATTIISTILMFTR